MVVAAVSPAVVRTAKVVRGCDRRPRSYVLAYLYLHCHGDETTEKQEFVDIELTSKQYRSHRGPSDQQRAFIGQLYKEVIPGDESCESGERSEQETMVH